MRVGKTATSLMYLKHRAPESFPSLIVVPANVKYNWKYECERVLGMNPYVCEGTCAPLYFNRAFGDAPRITIINYDILYAWADYFQMTGIKSIIFDESQFLINKDSRRTDACMKVAQGAKFVLGLSGTPLVNRPIELFPIINILWPKEFPDYGEYAWRYCGPRMQRGKWVYKGATNLEELNQKLTRCGMLRLRMEDVIGQLPSRLTRIVPCEISDREEYRKATHDFLGWLKENHPSRYGSAARAAHLTKIGYFLRLTAKLKFKSVVDWANEFLEDTEEKLILFAIHRKAIDVLKRRVNAESVVVDGGVSSKDRQFLIRKFQEDRKTRVFIGNIKAAGMGINLTAAREMAICELPWRPGDLSQASARHEGINVRHQTFVNYLIAVDTIEEDVAELIQDKDGVVSQVLDGSKSRGGLNLYDWLVDTLEKRIHRS